MRLDCKIFLEGILLNQPVNYLYGLACFTKTCRKSCADLSICLESSFNEIIKYNYVFYSWSGALRFQYLCELLFYH